MTSHDQTIARIQHFNEILRRSQIEKETLLIALGEDHLLENNQIREQIKVLEEVRRDFWLVFEGIIYED